MYRLILLRHGKAAPFAAGGDHERPLMERGVADAKRVGRYLADELLLPDFASVSDALRTRQTYEHVSAQWSGRIPVRVEPRLYEASWQTLLDLLRQSPDEMRTMLSVGHNPGFAELAAELVGYGDRYAQARLRDKFPTCALVVLDFDVASWSQVGVHTARLDRFVTPKNLGGQDD